MERERVWCQGEKELLVYILTSCFFPFLFFFLFPIGVLASYDDPKRWRMDMDDRQMRFTTLEKWNGFHDIDF